MRKLRGRSIRVGSMADAPRGEALALDGGGVPVDPYRTTLYSAAELYDTPSYADSLDAASSARP